MALTTTSLKNINTNLKTITATFTFQIAPASFEKFNPWL
jgi:hypothetical protein